MEIKATSKGEIVIPSSIRRRLGIKEGTRIQIEVNEREGEIVLRPMTRDYIRSKRGMFKGSGLMKELMAEKRREREL